MGKPIFNTRHQGSHKNGAGFTLIELLVVIAVIGLLASVVMVAMNSARVKARDARRSADLRQIRNALELYKQDNGDYPGSPTTYYWISDNNYPGLPWPPCPTSGGLATYINNICNIKDSAGQPYAYHPLTNGSYKVGAAFELSANQGPAYTWDGGTVGGWYEPK